MYDCCLQNVLMLNIYLGNNLIQTVELPDKDYINQLGHKVLCLIWWSEFINKKNVCAMKNVKSDPSTPLVHFFFEKYF